MKKKALLLISLLILLLFSTSVLAQNWLEELFGPFFKGLNMAEFYSNYSPAIDFIIAFMVFLSIAKVTFAQRFPGRPGTAISVALSFALAFGFSLFLNQLGINLGRLGPIAVVIFILAIGLAFYRYFTGLGAGAPGVGALVYVIIYLLITVSFPELIKWVEEQSSTLFLIFHAAFIISLIYSCIVFWGLLKGSRETTEFGRDLGRGAGAVGRGLGAAGGRGAKAARGLGRGALDTGRGIRDKVVGAEEKAIKKEAQKILSDMMNKLRPRIEFMKTPLRENVRIREAFHDPLIFIEEVMSPDSFAYQEYGVLVNTITSVLENDEYCYGLEKINAQAFRELQTSITQINSIIKERPILDQDYWEDVRKNIELNLVNRFGPVRNWKAKELEKQLKSSEAGKKGEAPRLFVEWLLKTKKLWPHSCDSLNRLFQLATPAINACEILINTKI